MVSVTYYELYQMNPTKAREKLLFIFKQTAYKIKKQQNYFLVLSQTVSKWSKQQP